MRKSAWSKPWRHLRGGGSRTIGVKGVENRFFGSRYKEGNLESGERIIK